MTRSLDERVASVLSGRKFSPDEPRIPGGKGGGRWTKGASGALLKAFHEDYQPGDWQESTRDDDVARLADDMFSGAIEVDPSADKDELRRLCEQEADKYTPTDGTVTLRNGHARITSRDPRVGRPELEKVAAQVDDMQARFPAGGNRLNVNVVGDKFPMADDHADAQTVHGESFVQLRGRIWGETKTSADGFMPTQDSHSRQEYALAHEWGHAIDNANELEKLTSMFHEEAPDLSAYAGYSPREAYAEAFAEWYLTKGHTTNKAARFYARTFGWGGPW